MLHAVNNVPWISSKIFGFSVHSVWPWNLTLTSRNLMYSQVCAVEHLRQIAKFHANLTWTFRQLTTSLANERINKPTNQQTDVITISPGKGNKFGHNCSRRIYPGIAPTTFWLWGQLPPWSRRLWYTLVSLRHRMQQLQLVRQMGDGWCSRSESDNPSRRFEWRSKSSATPIVCNISILLYNRAAEIFERPSHQI